MASEQAVLDPQLAGEVAYIEFEALDDASGAATSYRYEGSTWGNFYPEVDPGYCDVLVLRGTEDWRSNAPPGCAGFNVEAFPSQASEEIFWLPREGVSRFQVLWQGEQAAICGVVGVSVCEVFIPSPTVGLLGPT